METILLVKRWLEKWEEGDFLHLPITENFTHTSPFESIIAYYHIGEIRQDRKLTNASN